MKILGIETSCDETACAIVEDGKVVLSNVIASQIDLHAKTGGVVPEVAAREHVLKMIPVIEEALQEGSAKVPSATLSGNFDPHVQAASTLRSKFPCRLASDTFAEPSQDACCKWEDIDAVAVTRGPGLISSLIIGTETASVISYVKNLPLIPVQHIVGHVYSNWLEAEDEIQFPVIVLTVSGGHNELILMREHCGFEVLGETRDDAAGEAFDKVARILGLGYPGGPAISKAAEGGDAAAFDFPRSWLDKDSLDFSFSGLKTAVLTEVKRLESVTGDRRAASPQGEWSVPFLDEKLQADLAASFEEAVVEVLVGKLLMAASKFPELKEIHLAGGVSANKRLREVLKEKTPQNLTIRWPKSLSYCTDNAAMIAAAAYFMYQKNPQGFKPQTNLIPQASFEIF